MSRLPRSLAPLRHRGFRLLAGGQFASNIGDLFYAVALPWYVLENHRGALLLGTVLAAYGIPRTVMVAFGGPLSDRFRPWTVMMLCDAVRAVAVAALAIIAATHPASSALLVPVAVVLGAAAGAFIPGSFAIVPSLVPDEDLQAGNALTFGGTQLATLIGPAVGGAAVALVGAGAAFGVDAASFVISAVTLFGVRAAQQASALAGETVSAGTSTGQPKQLIGLEQSVGGEHVVALGTSAAPETDSRSVFQIVRSTRVLQVMFIVTIAANLGSGGLSEVALPALARGPFHAGASGYGAMLAAFGGGALIGTVLAGQITRLRRPAVAGSAAFFTEGILMAATPYLGGAIPAAVALAIYGGLNGFGNTVVITAFQRWAPAQMMGRLIGVMMFASVGIFPVSVFFAGVIVHASGAAVFFPIAGAILMLAIAAGLTQSSWREWGAVAPDSGGKSGSATVAQSKSVHDSASH